MIFSRTPEGRETRSGFAIGLSGSLLGRSDRAIRKQFARRFVVKDVATQVIGAVGVAEKAFNRSLDAGFNYGESLSDDAKYALTEIGLVAMRVQRTLPAEFKQMLTADGVAKFGRALQPTLKRSIRRLTSPYGDSLLPRIRL